MIDLEALLVARCERALRERVGSACGVYVGQGTRCLIRWAGGTVAHPELWAEGAPAAVTPATWFDVASLTKPMVTATLAMAMVSQGALALETPLCRYVPGAPDDVSIADVLGHRGGFAAHMKFYEQLRTRSFATARADLLTEVLARPRAQAPQQLPVYSDLGYIALAAALEAVGQARLDALFGRVVAGPLGLSAQFVDLTQAARPLAVATEVCPVRGLVCGEVHDENAHAAGGVCGHAGLFASLDDVAAFAHWVLATHAGQAAPVAAPHVVQRFWQGEAAPGSWRLGWDTPSALPGVSHAGDAWPRDGGLGHLGFTGTSLWLDVPRQGFVVLLTNRVHPAREASVDAIKALRRDVGDLAAALLAR